jgi:hypothetical protein
MLATEEQAGLPRERGRGITPKRSWKQDGRRSATAEELRSNAEMDQCVEVYCDDAFVGYRLPFPSMFRKGIWVSANTGAPLTAKVLGWRVNSHFVSPAKPKSPRAA